MWFLFYNIWIWLIIIRDSILLFYFTNRSIFRIRLWRNVKYESILSVCIGNLRIGVSGVSGERSEDLGGNMYVRGGEKFVKLEVIMNEFVVYDEF